MFAFMRGVLVTFAVVASAFAISVSFSEPAYALGDVANAMCNPWYIECPCNQVPFGPNKKCIGGKNTANCPVGVCKDVTSGFTTMGICVAANKCEGKTSSGSGGDLKGLQEALGMLKQIADLFKGQGGGGSGGGSGAPTGDVQTPTGCQQTYVVTQPSSDPCAIYNPNPISGGLGTISDSLLDAIGNVTATSSGNTVIKMTTPAPVQTNTNTNVNTNSNTIMPTQVTSAPVQGGTQGGLMLNATTSAQVKPAGYSGDVKVLESGATIVANFREGLSEVAGFFGSNTLNGAASQSAAGRLCSNRPWSRGVLSYVIPGSFFDGLCRWSGYQVGMTAQPITTSGSQGTSAGTSGSRVIIQPNTNSQIKVTQPSSVTTTAPGFVDIWAEPEQVRLGSRTYIFWNSRNVASCRASGPSFLQTSLSGGASTVPITGPSTFSIECTTTGGATVRDSVTVQLSL